MGLNPGGIEDIDDTGAAVEVGNASCVVMMGLGASALRPRVGMGFFSASVVAIEDGGGIPKGKAGIGKLGGGTAGGGIPGTSEPSVGKGTGNEGIVGMVGIVGIMTYMAAAASDEGGLGPTASKFNSPDSSLI